MARSQQCASARPTAGVTPVIFFRRIRECMLPLLRAIDILLCAFWLSLLYPLGLADRPTGREFISSYVGEALHNGRSWAKVAAAVIDWVFKVLAGEPNHCARSYEMYKNLDD